MRMRGSFFFFFFFFFERYNDVLGGHWKDGTPLSRCQTHSRPPSVLQSPGCVSPSCIAREVSQCVGLLPIYLSFLAVQKRNIIIPREEIGDGSYFLFARFLPG